MNVNILKTILKDLIISSSLNDTSYILKNKSIIKDLDLPEPIYHTEISQNNELVLDGKYMLIDEIIVDGGKLTIKEGTSIICKSKTSISVINNGKIFIEGTKVNPVTIKSSGDKTYFNGILIQGNNDNVGKLKHLNITNGKNDNSFCIILENVGNDTILNNITITEITNEFKTPSVIGIGIIEGDPKITDSNFVNLFEDVIKIK